MWRKPSEVSKAELGGKGDYHNQVPLNKAVLLWGGCSQKGFAVVAFHKRKKLKVEGWTKAVAGGKLVAAIKALKPDRKTGPWDVLCDNEGFMKAKASTQACKAAKVKLWHVPPRSPDLNPVEGFWGWLKRKLRKMDMDDALKRRPALGKMTYTARVRKVVKSKKAQTVAANFAKRLRKVCRAVVQQKGAATGY